MSIGKRKKQYEGEQGKTEVPLPDLFAYLDYRKFLRDYCAAKRAKNTWFSYRYLSGKVGIKSGGFFSWVLQGKRNISGKLVYDLAGFFGFSRPQTAYFEQLVAFNQANTHEERKNAFDKLLSMRRGSVRPVGEEQSEFYRIWYYSALRELVSIYRITDETVGEVTSVLSPTVKSAEVAKALALLVRLGMLRKNESGVYERCATVVSSKEQVPLVALHDYQIACMELAKEALDRFGKNERELSTVTMSIDNDAYMRIIERLAMFRAEVMEIARSVDKPSRVMQLNLQFFPLSRQKDGGRHA
ncbi:MAG: TIGR02147 family protein [Chitinispirillaceae bacterium]|nr:TIGR02147 family protein [Chitinispirillaceae bacterium]